MSLKKLWIVYWLAFFFLYLPLTRKPDLFSSKFTKGIVQRTWVAQFGYGRRTETHINPIVQYYVDSVEYIFSPDDSKNYFGFFKAGNKVTMIYEEGKPENAAIFSIIVYWLDYIEFAMALLVISLLTILYSGIKNWRKMTYSKK